MRSAAEESAARTDAARAGRQVRVAHLIESLGAGGAERLLYTNLKHLDAARFRSTVVTVFARPDHWAEAIRGLGVPVESLGCRSLRDLPAGVARLRRWLRANHTGGFVSQVLYDSGLIREAATSGLVNFVQNVLTLVAAFARPDGGFTVVY